MNIEEFFTRLSEVALEPSEAKWGRFSLDAQAAKISNKAIIRFLCNSTYLHHCCSSAKCEALVRIFSSCTELFNKRCQTLVELFKITNWPEVKYAIVDELGGMEAKDALRTLFTLDAYQRDAKDSYDSI